MFKIQLLNNDVTSGSVQISWCLDVELVKLLSDKNITDPHVLIITAPDGDNYNITKECRKVVPLKDLIAYVDFQSSGKHNIFAFMLSNKHEGDDFLLKGRYGWICHTLNNRGLISSMYPVFDKESTANSLSVDVPKQIFAKEPSEWEKKWVNWLHKLKAEDQCEFRRRRLFAYTIQPFLFLAIFSFRIFAVITILLFGGKGFSLNSIKYPLIYNTSSLNVEDVTFPLIGKDSDPLWRRYTFIPLTPSVILAAIFLASKIIYAVAFIISFILLILIITSILSLNYSHINKVKLKFKTENTDSEAWYLKPDEFNLITCNGDTKIKSFDDLPAKHKTIKLRFQKLKSQICRPFAR